MKMPVENNTVDYSIIICAYNPDERLLKRCLHAVHNLDTNNITTEVILVDNNSQVPIESLSYVREFLHKIPGMKIILAIKQGVKYARIAGIEEAKGAYIVYFDYDNEPESDYMQELKKLNIQYPQVAALGPGNVSVDFIDGIDKKIESYARITFQERHEETIKFASVQEWQSCYPFGTGLCTPAFMLKEYISMAKQEKFTMPGRTGKQLTSGEDTQMVLLCISKGYFAGVSPSLKINHIIPGSRTSISYLERLAYGTGLCYENCMIQVFPGYGRDLRQKIISGWKFSMQTLKKYMDVKLNSDPQKKIDLAQFIALNAGVYLALHKEIPGIVKKIIKNLKLE